MAIYHLFAMALDLTRQTFATLDRRQPVAIVQPRAAPRLRPVPPLGGMGTKPKRNRPSKQA